MNARRVSSLLLALGATVGVVASVGLLIGFDPSQLPPALIKVAAYKLTFIAALGLIAAGAVVSRAARRGTSEPNAALDPQAERSRLGEGPASPVAQHDRDAHRERVARERD